VATKTADVVRWESNTSNGRIALSSLEQIFPFQWDSDLRGAARMYPPAARAMSALLADARSAGHVFNVKYSYRTLAVQWVKWNLFGSPRAARPGTSNHGDALSVDLTNLSSSDIVWLRNNAHRYGFVNDVWFESWHWTYFGGWDDRMTEAERRQMAAMQKELNEVHAVVNRLVNGIEDFLAGKNTLPPDIKPERRKIFRAFRRAAKLPEGG
jgi:hypothetical protein